MELADLPTIDPALIDATPPEVASEVVDRAEINAGKPLVKYSATEAGLAALRKELAGKTYDLKTTKGDKEARDDRLRCVTLRTTLEKRRKAFKEPALEYGKLIDAEAKRITAEIEALEKPIDAAIKADEERRAAEKAERERIEAERVAKQRQRIAVIRGYVDLARGKSSDRIQAGINFVNELVIGEDYEEFREDAELARSVVVADLFVLLETARRTEAEAAERERQRAENERVAAELAEQRRQLEAAAAQLREDAERQRQEGEALRRELAANREAERIAAEAKAREDAGVKSMLDAMSAATLPPAASAPTTVAEFNPAPNASQSFVPQAELVERARGIVDDIIAAEVLGDAIKANPGPLVPLGKIGTRLGLTLTHDFVTVILGIKHHSTDKRAVLYTEAQYRDIIRALIAHLQAKLEAA